MRLDTWLHLKDISQADFGLKIGASTATVSRIVAGSQNIPLSVAAAISRETDGAVTADDLAGAWRDCQASKNNQPEAAA